MTFPFDVPCMELELADLDRLSNRFSQTVLDLVPYAEGPVSFVSSKSDGAAVAAAVRQVRQRRRPLINGEDAKIFMPIWNGQDMLAVAVLEGIDKKIAHDLSEEWLADRSQIISREFRLLKGYLLDPVTGLLNVRHLRDELELSIEDPSAPFSFVLLEICLKAKDAEKSLHYIARAGCYLNSYFGQTPLHHLGNGVFGLVLPGVTIEEAQRLGKRVLDWLKREKYHRAHLGFVTVPAPECVPEGENQEALNLESLLAQAWKALRTAGRRGPYALCAYGPGLNTNHPLAPPVPTVMNKLRQLWRRVDSFSLVLLHQDQPTEESFMRRLSSLAGKKGGLLPLSETEAYVFLPGMNAGKALAWTQTFKNSAKKLTGSTYSMGIAAYPFHDFRKSDMAANARKALLHTGFFGPDSITVFDGVSLNISGDIYYGGGDLVRAVREFRRGIEIDPANVNLLNSLGEAHAQMNRHRAATSFFEKALAIEADNFMALFNLGVTCLLLGDEMRAMTVLEKAISVSRRKKIDDANFDLYLQLGRLYCQTGKYQEAIELLSVCAAMYNNHESTTDKARKGVGRSMLFRYLGEAYRGVGLLREAMAMLQRAIRHNPRDAASLSLLGELYGSENQGPEIAISLCRQAVALDDSSWDCWYRLGLVNFRQGNLAAAHEAFQESFRRNRRSTPVLYMLGQLYEKQGKKRQALAKYKRALSLDPSFAEAKGAFAALN